MRTIRCQKISFGNHDSRAAGFALAARRWVPAFRATCFSICLAGLTGQAVAQGHGPSPLRPLAPVLSEAVLPDALADAIDPETMSALNNASADELLSGGRAAFEDGRHQDAQIFFEHLVARHSRTAEAVKARRYLAALYATVPEPAAGSSNARARAASTEKRKDRRTPDERDDRRGVDGEMSRAGMSMLGGDTLRTQTRGLAPLGAAEDQDARPAGQMAGVSSDFAASSQYQNSVDEFLTDRLRLDVGDRVFFSASSADLGARARGVLKGQAKWLIDRPNVNAVVAGHSDEQGSPQLNIEISALRAQAVRTRLIEEGVRAERIAVAALGRNEPVSPCQSPDCATQNRRAVLVIVNGRTRGGDWQPTRPRQDERPPPASPRAW